MTLNDQQSLALSYCCSHNHSYLLMFYSILWSIVISI